MKKIYDNLTASDVARIPASDLSFAIIKESYPLEEKKKMVVFCILSKVLWQDGEYNKADAKIIYCCDKAEKEITFYSNDLPAFSAPGRTPDNFKRMTYQGKAVDKCPFCGAEIVIKN